MVADGERGERSRGVELLKNAGIIGIGTMCTKALSFLLLPLYTALLSTSDYGIFDLMTTLTSLLVPIANCQLSQAIFRFVTEKRKDEEAVSRILTCVYVVSVVFALGYSVIVALILPFTSIEYGWVLIPSVVFNISLQVLLFSARGIGDNVTYALGGFVSASSIVLLNVLFLAVFDFGVQGMFASYLIGPIIGCAVIAAKDRLWRYFNFKLWNKETAQQMVRYAMPLVPNELSWWALNSADRVIVAIALGTAANGLLSVSSKFSTIYSTAFSVFNSAWTEQVVLHYRDVDGESFIRGTIDVAVRFFSGVLLLVMTVIPFVWPIMVNISYEAARTLCPLYMVAAFANLFTGLVSPIYLVNNESRKIMQATLVAAIIGVASLVALIPIMGLYAAPASTMVGYVVTAVIRVVDIEKRHMKLGFDYRIICATLVLAGVSSVSYFIGFTPVYVVVFAACSLYSILINYRTFGKTLSMIKR